MHFRLFNKPAAFGIDQGKPRMWIDGIYEDYDAGDPYEGRVQIHGSVGLMKVEVLDSNLPPNASVFIDQTTKEVVVKWLKYSPPTVQVSEVPNGSFEDDSIWEMIGPGFPAKAEQGWSPNGKGNLTYRDQKGEYTVFGGWAPVSNRTRQIEITGKVEHGKSSKGNASCGVGLAWYNDKRELVRIDMGNIVSDGGKGNWYKTSGIYSADAPEVRFVRPVIRFNRRKQNHPIHAGQIEWDHVYEVGYNEDETLWVEVKVTDSTHNTAIHRGIIEENNIWLTSRPYPILQVDSSDPGMIFYAPELREIGRGVEDAEYAAPSIGVSVSMRELSSAVTTSVASTPAVSMSVAMKSVINVVPTVIDNSAPSTTFTAAMKRIAVDPGAETGNVTPSIKIGVTLT
ncbi:endo-1,4-beta-xylanase [Stenotrophomonas phage SB2]|uniref:Endo-1,4-beta-xylanase n=1 Tax=Stenotrophomonas phage SB2 TaxID=3117468 RepID=A0ABZ2GUW8_9CAUD